MSDPLDLLRESIALSTPATLLTAASDPASTLADAAYLSFALPSGPVNLPKDAPTRYARTAGRTDFYTLGQLWLAWTEKDTGVRDYLVKGQAAGTGYVGITDRRGVVEYLQGEGDGAGRVLGKGEDVAVAPTTSVVAVDAVAGPSRQPKRKYEVDVADREFCKKLRAEVVDLRDRTTVLRATPNGKVNNFQPFVVSTMSERIRALRKTFDTSSRAPPVQAPTEAARGPKKAKATNPIIMISSSPTALVTMWNVRKFLEQGIFEPTDVARANEAAQGNTRAEDVVQIIRKRSGPNGEVSSKYYVVDGVEALQKFGNDAWDRVLCVVTTGQAWQFKPYRFSDPKVLFRNVKGVYFQWHNEPSNPAVREWNVTNLRIDRAKRHTDRQIVADFWRLLDAKK
ncbi:accessory factor associated with RNA polymerase II [Cryptotrichosporon argae]